MYACSSLIQVCLLLPPCGSGIAGCLGCNEIFRAKSRRRAKGIGLQQLGMQSLAADTNTPYLYYVHSI